MNFENIIPTSAPIKVESIIGEITQEVNKEKNISESEKKSLLTKLVNEDSITSRNLRDDSIINTLY